MQEPIPDPFIFPPHLWYGLLCEGVAQDPVTKKINLLAIFNRIGLIEPPAGTGVAAHAALNGILAIGFSGGLGHFEAQIELRNVDGHILWRRPEPWAFDLGPGEQGGAVLVQQVMYWFTQLGQYHYWVHLEPSGQESQIPFEVHRQVAPTEVERDDSRDQTN
jgi:hypothetical protein